ncbi:GntR family transcriptional regulator [Aeromonas veronii]
MSNRDKSVTEPRLSEQRVNEQSMADGRSSSKCEQICQTLRRYIGSGQLGAGQQLPAERALSERFATTRITIKEALSSLEADGLIYRAERRGWFVAPPRLTYDPAIHTHFHQWIGEQQRTAETRVLAHGSELYQQRYGIGQGGASLEITPSAARGAIARALNLAEGSAVLRLVRVNYDERGALVDCDIEHWRPDAIRICLDTRALQPLAGKLQQTRVAD